MILDKKQELAPVKLLKAVLLETVLITKRTFSRKISVSFSGGELNLRDNIEFEVF